MAGIAGQEALGLLETRGYAALVEATDCALKAANVELVSWERVGSALVTALFLGDVAAVTTAIEAGASAASKVGDLVSKHIIPNPHETIATLVR